MWNIDGSPHGKGSRFIDFGADVIVPAGQCPGIRETTQAYMETRP